MKTPDKIHTDVLSSARDSCYKARDAFYTCLDAFYTRLEKESGKKIASVEIRCPAECKESRDEYVEHCRASWVKHFDRLYCRNKTVQMLVDDKTTK